MPGLPPLYSGGVFLSHNEGLLVEHLLHNYSTSARPVYNITTTTKLQISFYIVQILKLSEKDQIFTATVWLNLDWHDEYLVWDKERWGIEEVRLPAETIWIPDLTLYNNAQESDPILTNMKASFAVLQHTGKVALWPRPLILQSNCPINVRYFPFDIQDCYLKFSSWAYNSQQVVLMSTMGVHLSAYIQSTEWELIHAETEIEYNPYNEGGGYSFLTFKLKIQRKALYYVVNLIMPCIMLSLVMLFGQYLPCNSGDAKVQLGTALFTSMCVFLLLVGTMMPPSDEQPLLGMYYGLTLFLITLSTGLNVFILNIVGRDTPVPRWMQVVVLHYMSRLVAPSLHHPYPVKKIQFSPMHRCNDMATEEDMVFRSGMTHSSPPPPPPPYRMTASSRLATHKPPSCGSVSAAAASQNNNHRVQDSPIREIVELKLDDNGKQLAQIRKTLEWIRLYAEGVVTEMVSKNAETRLHSDWMDVAVILDRSLMLLFTLIVTCTTLYIYRQYPSALMHGPHSPAQPNIVVTRE